MQSILMHDAEELRRKLKCANQIDCLYNESRIWLFGTFPRFRVVVLGKMMENDSEFEQSYESDDSRYNFISGYETEVEKRR